MSEQKLVDKFLAMWTELAEHPEKNKMRYAQTHSMLLEAEQKIARYESARVVLTDTIDNLKLRLQQVTLERDGMLERIAELLSMMKDEYFENGKLSGRTQHEADILLQSLPRKAKGPIGED